MYLPGEIQSEVTLPGKPISVELVSDLKQIVQNLSSFFACWLILCITWLIIFPRITDNSREQKIIRLMQFTSSPKIEFFYQNGHL